MIISLVCQTSLLESISETVVELPLPIIRLPHALMSIRALRLVQHAKGMQGLVLTTIQSLPALFNVIALLLLVVFVYSVAGCSCSRSSDAVASTQRTEILMISTRLLCSTFSVLLAMGGLL